MSFASRSRSPPCGHKTRTVALPTLHTMSRRSRTTRSVRDAHERASESTAASCTSGTPIHAGRATPGKSRDPTDVIAVRVRQHQALEAPYPGTREGLPEHQRVRTGVHQQRLRAVANEDRVALTDVQHLDTGGARDRHHAGGGREKHGCCRYEPYARGPPRERPPQPQRCRGDAPRHPAPPRHRGSGRERARDTGHRRPQGPERRGHRRPASKQHHGRRSPHR